MIDFQVEGRDVRQRTGSCGIAATVQGSQLICHGATTADLVSALSSAVQCPVLDHTGLPADAAYDLNVLFAPESLSADMTTESASPLIEAMKRDLGLTLNRSKGLVDVIVIDHLEIPSAN